MKIMVVDDEAGIRTTLSEILTEEGYEVTTAATAAEAEKLAGSGVDMAIVDVMLGSASGIEVLKKLKAISNAMPVVMITGHGSVELASQAFKQGALDFLEKPLRLLQVRTCVRNALESVRLRRELTAQKGMHIAAPVFAAPVMAGLFTQARTLAGLKEPVVITGPSGSGKELLAQSLHFQGSRAGGPFIATNAASMPLSLAEDELFGHEKGAFTGAERQRQGCFERASNGTLFLDEIGDMDLQVQAKLLRVLEQGQVMRLGSSTPLAVNVRLVCATHKDLEAMARAGTFRNDLWYRISAFVLAVPGLDKRKEDIPLLADHFLKIICAELSVQRAFAPAALDLLAERPWPGNVRELKHCVARLAVFCEEPLITEAAVRRMTTTASPSTARSPAPAAGSTPDEGVTDFRTARLEFEKRFFARAMAAAKGNITAAAQAIGMAQSNFSRKIKQLGLREPV
jgi:two-component system nitrogen regulation response regulator NtrX